MEELELPMSALTERYGVARSQIYARLDALEKAGATVSPIKRSRKVYIPPPLLALLDSMHMLIGKGSTVKDAAATVLGAEPKTEIEQPSVLSVESVGQSYETSQTEGNQIIPGSDRLEDLLKLALLLNQLQPQDELRLYRQLEDIAANGWVLPTKQLAQLLGLKTLSGKEFKRHGFKFTRVGKVGTQSGWKVEKL